MRSEEKKACRDCAVNEGIHCDVENCEYHEGECHCTAGMIDVGPQSATSSAETVCSTFKPKKN